MKFETLEPRKMLAANDIVTYAGGAGSQRFKAVHELSDGTFLVGGSADDLSWLPAGTPMTTFTGAAVDAINSAGTTTVGFLLRMSADLQTIQRAYAFADGKVNSIDRIRSTEIPGQATGSIYISGARNASGNADGYFIARLNGNAVSSAITGLVWGANADCRGTGDHEWLQPWDVRSDGRVVYGFGDSNSANWVQIGVLDAGTGAPTTMENWPNHWGTLTGSTSTTERANIAASAFPGTATYSGIVLKLGRSGGMRSYNQADFDLYQPDENNNPRKSKFPDDVFFSGPQNAPGVVSGGYTGYRTAGSTGVTARVGDIVIDRRNNHLYYGYNYKSVLPDGLPDFEPAVVAMDASGQMKWWARMYREFTDSNSNGVYDAGEPRNSTPDQYVDALAVDYSSNRLTILARCHGNNVNNFYAGNALVNSPGAAGFQNQWTGSSGNIHIHWLGKYGLNDGKIYNSTYVGDYGSPSTGQTTTFSSGNLQGWANPNAGWPDLNTTRTDSYELAVDSQGRTYMTAVSRRGFTTTDAFQKQTLPSQGDSVWASFVRVYSPALSTIEYSSLVRGAWSLTDTTTTGNNTELDSFIPTSGGVVVAGYHEINTTTGVALGLPTPTQNVPSWGTATVNGEQALLARLHFGSGDSIAPAVTASVFAFNEAAARVKLTFSEPVTDLAASDLVVTRLSNNTTVAVVDFTYDAATRTASFNLTTGGALLANGDYRATLAAGAVRDSAGNLTTAATTLNFFSLAGDANRDRSVTFADLLVLAGNYNSTSATWSTGDFNYDGSVNFSDLLILAGNYNAALVSTPASVSTRSTSRRRPSDVFA
jgi:hypothetical protein